MSEEKAAEKIQASFRGYKTRKSLKNNGALPDRRRSPSRRWTKARRSPLSKKNASKPNSAQADLPDELLDIDLTDKDLEKSCHQNPKYLQKFYSQEETRQSGSPCRREDRKEKSEEPTVNDKVENGENSKIIFRPIFSRYQPISPTEV
ncbi:hypothetical protein CEXT_491071 [Caerostris extrusa]|uniref:Uncharacterized protein n=1 Tax=Caerostris extrusa TaxID=172846 RepID=A0AAV4XZJ5_CAEEX|nr:hypothetical protein CEXT_491071 [Caerostris extrusa]